jgi:hypothetical protein
MPDDTEYPQWIEGIGSWNSGLHYCEKCHLQGAEWSYQGGEYHDDCAGEVMARKAKSA